MKVDVDKFLFSTWNKVKPFTTTTKLLIFVFHLYIELYLGEEEIKS